MLKLKNFLRNATAISACAATLIAGSIGLSAQEAQNKTAATAVVEPTAVAAATVRKAAVDYDGDGKTDFSVTRQQNSQLFWYTSINGTNEFRATQWGLLGDREVPADYDGDLKDDIAVWRSTGFGDSTGAYFFILNSRDNTFRAERFGSAGDDPTVVGDYDGDKKADVAVFRPDAGNMQAYWYYRPTATPGRDFVAVPWGLSDDLAYPGDFDGDGKYDFTVQRLQDDGLGMFYIRRSTDDNFEAVQWGFGDDVLVPGDYDGDGKTDLCVSRTDDNQNLQFFVLTRTGAIQYFTFGLQGDLRVPGDYNGDGRTDIGLYRRETATNGLNYFLVLPVNPAVGASADVITYQWGLGLDIPVANNFVIEF